MDSGHQKPKTSLRENIHEIIFEADTRVGKLFDILLIISIILSVVAVMLDSIPAINAQFGGQTFYEIRNGRVQGMLKDVSYQIRTPEFWNSMDQIGGPSTYQLGGTFGDGKGQPGQANAVSHGCPASRFRDVTIINTARGA